MTDYAHTVEINGEPAPPCIVMTYPNKELLIEASIALRHITALAGGADEHIKIADISNTALIRILQDLTDVTEAFIGNVTAAEVKEYLANELKKGPRPCPSHRPAKQPRRPGPGDAFSEN